MAKVQGRRMPHDMRFSGDVIDAKTGKPLVRDGFVYEGRPGDFKFTDFDGNGVDDPDAADFLEFRCPRSGRFCGSILVGHKVKPAGNSTWRWDGDLDRPPLSPSINCTGGCGWHGWLKAGIWED